MKNYLILILFLFQLQSFSQSSLSKQSIKYGNIYQLNEAIYMNENWEIVSSEDYEYYRTSEISDLTYENKPLIKVTDYFKNGNTQMTGYLTQTDSVMRKGLFTYFDSKGRITQLGLFDYDTYIDQYPEMLEYAKLIDTCSIENKYLRVKFYPKKIKAVGFKNSKMRNIGLWRYYKKNGEYFTANFKHGVDPTVIRFYDKKNRLIRKGYYVPKND